MALKEEIVQLGGVQLKKHYSDEYKKIQCKEDKNIYSIAYTAVDSTVQFKETTIPIDDVQASIPINVNDISGLSQYMENIKLSASNIVDLSSYIENSIDLTAVTQISAENVIGLSAYVENIIDMTFDGKDDDVVNVDLGSSTTD